MKRSFFISIAMLIVCASHICAQIENVKSVYIYGVDFSLSKAKFTTESNKQFIEAFTAINELLINEPKKYDFHKYLRKEIAGINIDVVKENNENRDFTEFRSNLHQLADEEAIASLVKKYVLKETEGTGVIIIPFLLDKEKNQMILRIVFFDVATRNVLQSVEKTSRAGGFGLRNFWAKSVFEALKSWKNK